MEYTISRLLGGDESVVQDYVTARNKWAEFFHDKEHASLEEWANWLSAEQIPFFEQKCGGRHAGQEVMVWSGFGTLYNLNTGLEDNLPLAKKLAQAFAKSTCSMEVKISARKAAESYSVNQ